MKKENDENRDIFDEIFEKRLTHLTIPASSRPNRDWPETVKWFHEQYRKAGLLDYLDKKP